jgi:hypothetical protein
MPARRRNKIIPALAIEAAIRQEVLGQKGIYFGNHIVSSDELRRMAEPPLYPLPPFYPPVPTAN